MARFARRSVLFFACFLLSLATVLATAPAPVAATAPTGTTGIWSWQELPDGTLRITGCSAATGELVFPATLAADGQNRTVTTIGDHAFYLNQDITGLTFPTGLTTIETYAFCGLAKLTSVSFPTTMRTFGDYAFAGCDILESVALPEGLLDTGVNTWSDSPILAHVTLPSTLTTIGDSCFCNTALESIDIPASVTTIEAGAFNGTNLVSVTVPATVETIGASAFAFDFLLTRIEFLNPDVSFGDSMLMFDKALTTVRLPYGFASIPRETFQSCESLTTVYIPEGVTSIGVDAFRECSSLASIALPNTLETIGGGAFAYTAFASFEVPLGVTSIGESAFYQCPSLTDLTFFDPTTAIDPNFLFAYDSPTIHGFLGSTAQSFATDHPCPFVAIDARPARIDLQDAWAAYYGRNLAPGQTLTLDGTAVLTDGTSRTVEVYAQYDDLVPAKIATVSLAPSNVPESTGSTPLFLASDTADFTASYTLPTTLSEGWHSVKLTFVDSTGLAIAPQVLFFSYKAPNPQTGDPIPWIPLAALLLSASALVAFRPRRRAGSKR